MVLLWPGKWPGAENSAKLLGPIVADDLSREREQSFSVAPGQNQTPAVAA
jgi:hypothetical protein